MLKELEEEDDLILSQIQLINSRSGTRSRRRPSTSLLVADKVSSYVEMRQEWVKEQEKVRFAQFANRKRLLISEFHSVYKNSKAPNVLENNVFYSSWTTNGEERRPRWMSVSSFLIVIAHSPLLTFV